MESQDEYKRLLVRPFLKIILFSFVVFTDPFGLRTLSAINSQEIFLRLYAPFYGLGSAAPVGQSLGVPPGAGLALDPHELITVVLINDETMSAFAGGGDAVGVWPPPLDFYGWMLELILEHRPAAIFVDIIVSRNRPNQSLGALSGVLDKEEGWFTEVRQQTPIYFAGLRPVMADPDRPGLTRIAGDPADTTIPFIAQHADDVLPVEWAESPNNYPLILEYATESGEEAQFFMTPATQLYVDYVNRFEENPTITFDPDSGRLVGARELEIPLTVIWGRAVSPTVARVLDASGCALVDPTIRERIGEFVRLLAQSLLPVGDKLSKQGVTYDLCIYSRTVFGHQFFRHRDAVNDETRALFTDKIVLLGADIRGQRDVIDSPAQGYVPGVVYHAMALDNLLRYGNSYFYDVAYLEWDYWSAIIEIITYFLVVIIGVLVSRSNQIDKMAIYFVFCVILILVICGILFFWVRLSPVNWIGLLAFAIITYPMSMKDWMSLLPRREKEEKSEVYCSSMFQLALKKPVLLVKSVVSRILGIDILPQNLGLIVILAIFAFPLYTISNSESISADAAFGLAVVPLILVLMFSVWILYSVLVDIFNEFVATIILVLVFAFWIICSVSVDIFNLIKVPIIWLLKS